MGYVVIKRNGNHVELVSSRAFDSREEALLDLSDALADSTVRDDAASFVVVDMDVASPVLLLPVVPERAEPGSPGAEIPEADILDSTSETLDEVAVEESGLDDAAAAYLASAVAALDSPFLVGEELLDPAIEGAVLEESADEQAIEQDAPEEGASAETWTEDAHEQGPDAIDERVAPFHVVALPNEAAPEPAPTEPAVPEPEPVDPAEVDRALDEILPVIEPAEVADIADIVERLEVEPGDAVSDEEPAPAEDELGLDLRTEVSAADDEPETAVALAGPTANEELTAESDDCTDSEPEAEPESEVEPEPEMPGYAAGDSDIESLTCNDCVYVETCPNKDECTPAECGSFQ